MVLLHDVFKRGRVVSAVVAAVGSLETLARLVGVEAVATKRLRTVHTLYLYELAAGHLLAGILVHVQVLIQHAKLAVPLATLAVSRAKYF